MKPERRIGWNCAGRRHHRPSIKKHILNCAALLFIAVSVPACTTNNSPTGELTVKEGILCRTELDAVRHNASLVVTIQNLTDQASYNYVGHDGDIAFLVDMFMNGSPVKRTSRGGEVDNATREFYGLSSHFYDGAMIANRIGPYGEASSSIKLDDLFELKPNLHYTVVVRRLYREGKGYNVLYGTSTQFDMP